MDALIDIYWMSWWQGFNLSPPHHLLKGIISIEDDTLGPGPDKEGEGAVDVLELELADPTSLPDIKLH